MNLSKYEQETIILFNEAEKTATIETCNKGLQNRLDGFCSKSPDIYRTNSTEPFKKYVCPKRWVKVRMPRQLSDEQRQKLKERACANLQRANAAREEQHGGE